MKMMDSYLPGKNLMPDKMMDIVINDNDGITAG